MFIENTYSQLQTFINNVIIAILILNKFILKKHKKYLLRYR